jgi:hypothetical protein
VEYSLDTTHTVAKIAINLQTQQGDDDHEALWPRHTTAPCEDGLFRALQSRPCRFLPRNVNFLRTFTLPIAENFRIFCAEAIVQRAAKRRQANLSLNPIQKARSRFPGAGSILAMLNICR